MSSAAECNVNINTVRLKIKPFDTLVEQCGNMVSHYFSGSFIPPPISFSARSAKSPAVISIFS
jgi:hypothetical protein